MNWMHVYLGYLQNLITVLYQLLIIYIYIYIVTHTRNYIYINIVWRISSGHYGTTVTWYPSRMMQQSCGSVSFASAYEQMTSDNSSESATVGDRFLLGSGQRTNKLPGWRWRGTWRDNRTDVASGVFGESGRSARRLYQSTDEADSVSAGVSSRE
jgi:hypothetical protein